MPTALSECDIILHYLLVCIGRSIPSCSGALNILSVQFAAVHCCILNCPKKAALDAMRGKMRSSPHPIAALWPQPLEIPSRLESDCTFCPLTNLGRWGLVGAISEVKTLQHVKRASTLFIWLCNITSRR